MAKKIMEVVKELGETLHSIAEHLNKKGFDVDARPTVMLTDEMLDVLYKDFKNSLELKGEVDKISLGANRPHQVHEEKKAIPSFAPTFPSFEKPEVIKASANVENLSGLKVVGKVDLNPPKKEKAPEEPIAAPPAPVVEQAKTAEKEAVVEPTPEPKAEPVVPKEPIQVEKPIEPKTPQTPETPVDAEPEIIRAEAAQLRGLKIQGKIDINKFTTPGIKKKEKEAAKPATPNPGQNNNQNRPLSAAEDAKRKRKRVSVASPGRPGGGPPGQGQGQGQGTANKNFRKPSDEPKEVSQKEIDEKIKATMARLAPGGKKKRQKVRRDKRDNIREKKEAAELERDNQKLQLTEFVSVSELASLLDVSLTDVITTCMNLGVIVSINQRLDAEIIELVANEFGSEVEFISVDDQEVDEDLEVDDEKDLLPRAPIVTVMGHVDHGKTSLLDYVRRAKVAASEAGGITQHIGAYEVEVGPENRKITFLDTPGHEAFTAMRARGAKVTDIVIIVIAADDNIMPQTKEAISHAQAAGVPMVFAINKVDKAGANPEKIKESLSAMNILVEEWGGTYQSQDISAKTGLGIDILLEKILLQADILELTANPNRLAVGTVVEATLEKGKGYVTKVLVQTGTLRIGDPLVAGEFSGKVKAMSSDTGQKIIKAGPSTPVLVLGISGAPQAGEKFKVTASESEARQMAAKRAQISREQATRANKRISLEEIGRRLALGNFKELNLIVKADVDGSVEALSDALIKQSIDKVQVNVIHKAVGQIIESDVLLASASDAIIVGFQVRPSVTARKLAEKEGVEIKTYSIIYQAIDEIRSAIEGMLEPTKEENITAQIEVREVYKISKLGTIAGCYVTEGKVTRNSFIRLIRDGIVIFPTKEGAHGELSSLKRFKDDMKEVKTGFECGLTIKNYNDIEIGDTIEAYEIVEVKAKLS